MRPLSALLLLSVLLSAGACSDDTKQDPAPRCDSPGVYYDPVIDDCVIDERDTRMAFDTSDASDTEMPDTEMPDTEMPDTEMPDTNIDPACDKDNDGALSMECGGDDCDDDNAFRTPGRIELCDDLDNDCNDRLNDNISCGFYAHTAESLLLIDPFTNNISVVAVLPRPDGQSFNDIDTHPSGDLYGITQEALFVYVASADLWVEVERFDEAIEFATGFAFDGLGTGFVTANDDLFSVDPSVEDSSGVIGKLGGPPYLSSGDCVVNKLNTLYMTSRHTSGQDTLVSIDRDTGLATEIGPIGFDSVYALTFAYGTFYGLTSGGDMISINPDTGEGTFLHNFEGVSFFGAASTPNR